jgi:hypothetical protein
MYHPVIDVIVKRAAESRELPPSRIYFPECQIAYVKVKAESYEEWNDKSKK